MIFHWRTVYVIDLKVDRCHEGIFNACIDEPCQLAVQNRRCCVGTNHLDIGRPAQHCTRLEVNSVNPLLWKRFVFALATATRGFFLRFVHFRRNFFVLNSRGLETWWRLSRLENEESYSASGFKNVLWWRFFLAASAIAYARWTFVARDTCKSNTELSESA